MSKYEKSNKLILIFTCDVPLCVNDMNIKDQSQSQQIYLYEKI
jgi:hypothetical protein